MPNSLPTPEANSRGLFFPTFDTFDGRLWTKNPLIFWKDFLNSVFFFEGSFWVNFRCRPLTILELMVDPKSIYLSKLLHNPRIFFEQKSNLFRMGGIFRNNLGSSADAGGRCQCEGKIEGMQFAWGNIYTLLKKRGMRAMLMMICVWFFLFWFRANIKKSCVFPSGLMDWKPRPRSGKVIGEQFSYCM